MFPEPPHILLNPAEQRGVRVRVVGGMEYDHVHDHSSGYGYGYGYDVCSDPRATAIVEWINSFDAVSESVDNGGEGGGVSSLFDCVLVSKALHEIDPFFSDLEILLRIEKNGNNQNWKECCVSKVVVALDTFYSDVLKKGLKVRDRIDPSAIVNYNCLDDFVNLMELVYGATAMCDNHEVFDERLHSLSQSTQDFFRELKDNVFTNTFDLVDDIGSEDDISDISGGSGSDHDVDSGSYPGWHAVRPTLPENNGNRSSEDFLLKQYLATKDEMGIQEKAVVDYEDEVRQLKQTIENLTTTNLALRESLTAEQTCQDTQSSEKLKMINDALHSEISTLADRANLAESQCLELQKDMELMLKDVQPVRELKYQLAKANEVIATQTIKLDCLSPVVAINEHLENSLKETQEQLEEVEMAVSTRLRLEEELRTHDLEDLQQQHERLKQSFTEQQEEVQRLVTENEKLRGETVSSQSLIAENENMKDELSLQYIKCMKMEQKLNSHQELFQQYKVLIHDSYTIIKNLECENKLLKLSSPEKKKNVQRSPNVSVCNSSPVQSKESILNDANF